MENIYYIQVTKNEDDSIVDVIYKLVILGDKVKKYLWINILDNDGIGTARDFDVWCNTIEDAFIQLNKYSYSDNTIIKGTLEDALSYRNKFLVKLADEL